jgi:hypothetical protein
MNLRHSTLVTLVTLVGLSGFLGGCASARGGNGDLAKQSDVRFERGGFILTGRALEDGPGTIIAALVGKIPNFRLQRNSGRCPIITLRNAVSFKSVANPHVYVDGTRATDTCVLTQLRTIDVASVEVYPQGFTQRPGYGTNSHGLILVFMKGAGT